MTHKANFAAQTIEAVLNSDTVEMTTGERLSLSEARNHALLLQRGRDHWKARARDESERNSVLVREVLALRTDKVRLTHDHALELAALRIKVTRLERELHDAHALVALLSDDVYECAPQELTP